MQDTAEWGWYKNWLAHDSFEITLETEDRAIPVASGDVNTPSLSMEDLPISFGLCGISEVKKETILIKGQAGQFVDLVFKMKSTGWDRDPLDSFVAVTDVEVIDGGGLVPHSNGMWSLGQYIGELVTFKAGNILSFDFTNPGFPGITLDIKEVTTGQSAFIAVLPFCTKRGIMFSKPCEGETDWQFLISTRSNMSKHLKWEAFSNWIP